MQDLGFFRSIQALQYKKKLRTILELIEDTESVFNELKLRKIDKVFLTYKKVLPRSYQQKATAVSYEPHQHKARRRRAGEDAEKVICERETFNKAKSTLEEFDAKL